jgi:hypothetical protein
MARPTEGAAVLYNSANPAYHRWPELWPPIAAALLEAAERAGAVLVTISNRYGYGPAWLAQGTAGARVGAAFLRLAKQHVSGG